MSEIISYFPVFDCLPKTIVEKIRCFFVTQKFWPKIGYCATNEDKVYAVGQHISYMFGIEETNEKLNYALIPELCDQRIEEFYEGHMCVFARNINNKIIGFGKNKLVDQFKSCINNDDNRLDELSFSDTESTDESDSSRLGESNENVLENLGKQKLEYINDKNIIEMNCDEVHCLALTAEGVPYGLGIYHCRQSGFNKRQVCIPIIFEFKEEIRNEILSVHCYEFQSFVITIKGDIYEYTEDGVKLLIDSKTMKNTIEYDYESEYDCPKFFKRDDEENIGNYITFVKGVNNVWKVLFEKQNYVFEYNIYLRETLKTNYETVFEYFLVNFESTHKTIHMRDNQLFVFNYNKSDEISLKYKTEETIVPNIEDFCQKFNKKTAMNRKLRQFKAFDDLPKNIESDVKCYYFTKGHNSEHTSALFVMSDSKVYGAGRNECGKLGFGHNQKINYYTPIPELYGENIEDFFEGPYCMFAINDKSQIYGWGRNEYGRLLRGYQSGLGEYLKPDKIDYFDDKNIVQISCGDYHCLALSSDGVVYGWGRHILRENVPVDLMGVISKPIIIEFDMKIKYIYCYEYWSTVIDIDGKEFFWENSGYTTYDINTNNENNQYKNFGINYSKKKVIILDGSFILILTDLGYIYMINSKNIIVSIESDVIFTDIHEKNRVIAIQSEECVYEIFTENIGQFKGTMKTDYLNFYDFYLHKYQLIYKTIHITNDGFLITKDIKFNQNYNKTNEQKPLQIENTNVFDRKYDKLFEYINIKGKGGFGEVMEVKNRLDNKVYALKIVKLEDDLISTLREVKILSQMKSDFVVQYITAWIETKVINKQIVNFAYIQMHLCSKSLREVIKSLSKINDERFKTFKYYISCELFRELTECVDYLHSLTPPIIHRDLKPENVLISDTSNGRFLKLCDFGLAKLYYDDSQHTRGVGTLKYMAPEVRDSNKYDLTSDIFSLSVIAIELFDITYSVKEIRKKLPEITDSENFTKLLETLSICFSKDFKQRFNCKQMLYRISEWTVDTNIITNSENYLEFTESLKQSDNNLLLKFFENKFQ